MNELDYLVEHTSNLKALLEWDSDQDGYSHADAMADAIWDAAKALGIDLKPFSIPDFKLEDVAAAISEQIGDDDMGGYARPRPRYDLFDVCDWLEAHNFVDHDAANPDDPDDDETLNEIAAIKRLAGRQ